MRHGGVFGEGWIPCRGGCWQGHMARRTLWEEAEAFAYLIRSTYCAQKRGDHPFLSSGLQMGFGSSCSLFSVLGRRFMYGPFPS